jgi:hypothetical protein
LPRIRNGLVLSAPNSIVAHYVNFETLSCEATKSKFRNNFDAVQWYSVDFRYSLDNYFYTNRIGDDLYNFTSTFPAKSPLVRNNSIFNCCTLKNGTIINCQSFLAYIVDKPEKNFTTVSLTTLTSTSANLKQKTTPSFQSITSMLLYAKNTTNFLRIKSTNSFFYLFKTNPNNASSFNKNFDMNDSKLSVGGIIESTC